MSESCSVIITRHISAGANGGFSLPGLLGPPFDTSGNLRAHMMSGLGRATYVEQISYQFRVF